MYGVLHNDALLKGLKSRKSIPEVIESGSLKVAVEEIRDLLEAEEKDAKANGAKASSVPTIVVDDVAGDEVETSVASLSITMKAIGLCPSKVDEVASSMKVDDVGAFLKIKMRARNFVKTYITLVQEESTEIKMAKVIAETPAGQVRGVLKDCVCTSARTPCATHHTTMCMHHACHGTARIYIYIDIYICIYIHVQITK